MSAKVTYVNGSYLTPTALNGYFGVSAATGHVHDSGSDATCAPKIDVTSCLSGLIPAANLYTSSGTFNASMRAVGGGAVVVVIFDYVVTNGVVRMSWGDADAFGFQSDTVHKTTTPVLLSHGLAPLYADHECFIKVGAFGVATYGSFVAMTDGNIVLACTTPVTAYVSQVVEYKL